MNYIFLAFYGWPEPPINQEDPIIIIDKNFEFWNLKKFSAEEFVNAIKIKIPPINNNVLRNYLTDGKTTEGIDENQFNHCCWGILVPSLCESWLGHIKSLSLLNMFSTKYLHPAFFVTNMGISKVRNFNHIDVLPNDHQGYEQFKTTNFSKFYRTMADLTKYFIWSRDEALKWSEEDWRLFMAAGFYDGLQEYERSKNSYTWQRESADMATLLETLFTAGDSQNEEVGYRLRKRVGSLIQWKFNDIEKEIKVLYKDRSEFVHGSYYKGIIKGMKKNQNDNAMPPLPDFEKLYKTKERIRFIFVAYLYLHKIMISNSEEAFKSYSSVQKILEDAILNIDLRKNIVEIIKPLIELLPQA